jgi:exonuclease V gamma subunit
LTIRDRQVILDSDVVALIRELARTVSELSETTEDFKQKSLMQKGGEIIADILGDDLKTTDTETSIELNFAVMKFKHTIKRKQ